MVWIIALALVSMLAASGARADNFKSVRYDPRRDRLVVQMVYLGTNPNHTFHLNWGRCRPLEQEPGMWQIAVDVLDDQWNDAATTDYAPTLKFDLSKLRCRPARVTLRTAPRFYYTLTIPADTGASEGQRSIHTPSPPTCPPGFVHRGGSMCVPREARRESVGADHKAQTGTLMSKPEPLIVKPGLEIAIFGKCGYHTRDGATSNSVESTSDRQPGCAGP